MCAGAPENSADIRRLPPHEILTEQQTHAEYEPFGDGLGLAEASVVDSPNDPPATHGLLHHFVTAQRLLAGVAESDKDTLLRIRVARELSFRERWVCW